MVLKTSDLPGIGKKHALKLASGDNIVIITHHHGQRDIYHFNDIDDDAPDFTIELSDEESRLIGGILLGVDYQPVTEDKVEMFAKNIHVYWFTVKPESCLADKSVAESEIRNRTGATIIGIKRGDEFIGSPDANEILRSGDNLMVIGKREPIKALESMCRGAIPGTLNL